MWEVLPQKLVTPKNWLPQKIDKKMATPPKNVSYPKKLIKKKLATPKKMLPPKK